MSNNIIKTKGHHTYRYEPPYYTDAGTPIYSKITGSGENTHFPFLGEGYYFWDNNIERAKRWGKQRYNGHYGINEYPLVLEGEYFLDLAGSRQDLYDFFAIVQKIWDKLGERMPIGQTICLLQTLERQKPGTFPFKIIRSLNVKTKHNTISYNSDKNIKSSFLLDPEIIICFFDRNDVPIGSKIC